MAPFWLRKYLSAETAPVAGSKRISRTASGAPEQLVAPEAT
jgi:hypothetical protein